MTSEKLGFIGLGNMGYPMARNLEKAGFPLFVYNRTAARTAGFSAQSIVSASVSELTTHADLIFTMLTNDQAVKEVYQQILTTNIHGKLFVDLSTVSREASLDINNAIKARGGSFIDAPVAGSTGPAEAGTLIIMAGGQDTDIERARPYLEKMGRLIVHPGGNGQGLAAKLCVNYFLAMLYEGLAETMLFADKMGVARKDLLEIINESASGSLATKIKTPLLLNNDFKPAFALDLMLKDMLLARDAGADFPAGEAVLATYQKAEALGFGKQDVMAVIKSLVNG